METYTYIDATEYPTRAETLEQITYIDGLLCEMEEETKALLASDDRDDFARYCDMGDYMNDLRDQILDLQRLLSTQ